MKFVNIFATLLSLSPLYALPGYPDGLANASRGFLAPENIKPLSEQGITFSTLPNPMCCATCTGKKQKYFSILDEEPGFCGETCIVPTLYTFYKNIEPDLLKATVDFPCRNISYVKYNSTVTHTSGSIAMNFDLYTP